MRWKATVVRVLTAVMVGASGMAMTPAATAVEGGNNALFEPWFAKVTMRGSLCTGEVITDRWVMTAAHCVGKSGPASGAVHLGERAQHSFPIEWVEKAPGGADLALVRVKGTMGVRPVTLPGPGPLLHQPGQISGWGKGRFPMQQGAARVEGFYVDRARGNAQMFVTRSIIGNQEAGDSGGPFHIGPVVFGVLSSTGAKDGAGHIGANYTRVDQFVPWIYQTAVGGSRPVISS